MITEIFQGQQMFSSAVWHITDREIQSPLSFPLDIWISEEEGESDEAFCLLSSTHSDRPAESQPSCRDTRLIYIHDLHTFSPLLTHLFSVETAHYHDKITKRDTHQGLCSYNKEMQHIGSALDSFTESRGSLVQFSSLKPGLCSHVMRRCNDFRTTLVTTVCEKTDNDRKHASSHKILFFLVFIFVKNEKWKCKLII